jgi:hypothetical protein
MSTDPDDDALSWGDEKDPTYVESPGRIPADTGAVTARLTPKERRERAARDDQAANQAAGSSEAPGTSSPTAPADDDEPQGMSSLMLLSLGLLGGIYLLYTVGWFVSAQRTDSLPVGIFDVVMAEIRIGLSVTAPALWFGATLLFTRKQKPAVRILALILGVLFLLPLPFALGY